MAYPTAAELVGRSTVAALTEKGAEEQERLWRASVKAVEEFCQQKFTSRVGTEAVDGPGGRRLYLPRRLALLSQLLISGSSITELDVVLDEDKGWLEVKPTAGWGGNYYERASRAADGITGLDFTFGYGTVAITGTWGWLDSEFPPEVGDAILLDMEATALADKTKLTQTIRGYRHLGIRDISQGNMRASIGGAPGLPDEAISLLSDYVWTPPLGANV
jgi:hypothetical protein